MAATWDTPLVHTHGPDHLHRGPRQIQRGHAREPPRAVLRPHLLGAQHQHLSRSALGPRPGNLRRRSLPHRPHGRRLRHRHAGRRSRITSSVVSTPKHFAVHSGPERTRHSFNVDVSTARSRRHLPARVPRRRHRGARAVGDVRLQRHRRRARLRQHHAAPGSPARRVALRRLRRLRLRRRRRHLHRPSLRARHGPRRRRCGQGRHRPRMRLRARPGFPAAGRRRPPGPDQRSRDRHAPLHRLFRARFRLGMFDPPSSYAYGRIPFSESQLAGAPRALAARPRANPWSLLKNRTACCR